MIKNIFFLLLILLSSSSLSAGKGLSIVLELPWEAVMNKKVIHPGKYVAAIDRKRLQTCTATLYKFDDYLDSASKNSHLGTIPVVCIETNLSEQKQAQNEAFLNAKNNVFIACLEIENSYTDNNELFLVSFRKYEQKKIE